MLARPIPHRWRAAGQLLKGAGAPDGESSRRGLGHSRGRWSCLQATVSDVTSTARSERAFALVRRAPACAARDETALVPRPIHRRTGARDGQPRRSNSSMAHVMRSTPPTGDLARSSAIRTGGRVARVVLHWLLVAAALGYSAYH